LIKELLSMAVHNMLSRKLRSFLTLLGIVIGVAAVVATLSLGIGMQENLVSQFEKFQADVITVIPQKISFSPGPPQAAGRVIQLTETDVNELSKINGVYVITGAIESGATIQQNDETGNLNVAGIEDPEIWQQIQAKLIGLEKGRFIAANDANGIVIGYSVAYEMFSNDIDLKKTIIINNQEFKVVGILKKAGGFMRDLDQGIFMSIKPAREIFGSRFEPDEFSYITLKIEKGQNVEIIGQRIEEKMLNIHKQTKDTQTFTIFTPKFFQEQISSIMNSFTFFLIILGTISLIIGGIGIMNIMYVSVMERTREIGVMKAIGASNNVVLMIFLFEAGIFGLIGGILGIGLGTAMSYGFGIALSGLGGTGQFFTPYMSVEIVGLALFFGFSVGIISGYFPAKKASKMNPVEALRYE
jgi:putative ABC transport system permease protein